MSYDPFLPYEKRILTEYFEKKGYIGRALSEAIENAEQRLDEGYPLAYLVGEQAFFDLVFKVNASVLIPRPDTERLVEEALMRLGKGATFADLGTGSGCIAISILYRRPDLSGYALDISQEALSVAKDNAAMAKVEDRLTLIHADMKDKPPFPKVEYIVSNPPYIPERDMVHYPSLAYEPRGALVGGKDGMDFYRTILEQYQDHADKGFLFEIGYDQKEAITALAEDKGYTCLVKKDYGGNDRVAILTKTEGSL